MIPFQTLLAENAPFLGTFVQSAAPEFLEASAYAGFRFAASIWNTPITAWKKWRN